MLFASFKYKTREYVYLYNENKLKYGYKDDIIKYDLTLEEKALMDKVLSKIIISNNFVKLKKIDYNDKTFQAFYDEVNKHKFFLQIKDDRYLIPSEEDYRKLFSNYCASVILYNNHNSKDKKPFIKIIEGINVKIYLFSILLGLAVGSLIDIEELPILNSEEEIVEEKSYSLDEIYDLFNLCLNQNENLSRGEVEIIRKCFLLVEENYKYMDIDMLASRLKNLNIVYDKEEYIKEDEFINGTYDVSKNLITIYGAEGFDELSFSQFEALFHEISHVFSNDFNDIAQRLQEAINEVMTYEYLDEYQLSHYDGSYYDERVCLYALCEIVGTDCFRNLHFTNDLKPLKKEMMNIIDDKEKFYTLIDDINNMHNYKGKKLKETHEEIYSLIKEYYEEKYNKSIEDNEYMNSYFKHSYFMSDDKISPLKIKPLFSKNYKMTHSSDYNDTEEKLDELRHIVSKGKFSFEEDYALFMVFHSLNYNDVDYEYIENIFESLKIIYTNNSKDIQVKYNPDDNTLKINGMNGEKIYDLEKNTLFQLFSIELKKIFYNRHDIYLKNEEMNLEKTK